MKIHELLEARFDVENPISEVKRELDHMNEYADEDDDRRLEIDTYSGRNLLIVQKANANDEDDPAVEIEFDEHAQRVQVRLFVDNSVVKTCQFKPHFPSPTSSGRFEVEDIAGEAEHFLRDAQYHSINKLKVSDLHDDPDVRAQLKDHERAARMRRRT